MRRPTTLPPAWTVLGHELSRHALQLLDHPEASLVLSVEGTPHHYVQWHGEQDRDLYCEAASGLYDGLRVSPDKEEQLLALGWAAPYAGWGGADVANFSLLFTHPVSLYDVVVLTCRTLADVYGAQPEQITW